MSSLVGGIKLVHMAADQLSLILLLIMQARRLLGQARQKVMLHVCVCAVNIFRHYVSLFLSDESLYLC